MDPREKDPFESARDGSEEADLTLEELSASFAVVDRIETTAVLAVMSQMAGDELVRARARRELVVRQHDLPSWLVRLNDTHAYRTVEMAHVLGDGDNVMVGARLSDGHELTLVVYVDHNLGSLVKDAFVVTQPIGPLIEFMRARADDPDCSFVDIAPADAKCGSPRLSRPGP